MVQARGDSIFQQQINASRGNSEEDAEEVPPMPVSATDGITEVPIVDGYNHALPSEYTSQRTGTAPLALNNQNLSSEEFNMIGGLQNANLSK